MRWGAPASRSTWSWCLSTRSGSTSRTSGSSDRASITGRTSASPNSRAGSSFIAARAPRPDQLFLFEEFATRSFYEPDYPPDAYLVFGQETKGLPKDVVAANEQRLVGLPMLSDKVRSLNLANSVVAAAYQALREYLPR